nr:serine hydrolase domain-containing protein [Ornithinimicrobium sp. HY1793]
MSLGLLTGCGAGGPDTIDAFVQDTTPDGSRGVIAAAQGDDLVLCEGWGLADDVREVEFGCDTVVDVMSMTKQFTAAAVLKLQMFGELDVSDPIGDYLEGVPEDKQSITIQQLLTHTSGLGDQLGDDDDPITRDELVAAAMDSPLQFEPGTYAYSNLGYSLLAAIVEIASGDGYEQFLAEHLFAPSEMASTGYVLPDWTAHDVAVEYDQGSGAQGSPLDHEWADDGPWWNLRGNGGLLSTARDMYRWHLALLGNDILDENAKGQLFEPRVREEPDDTHYGYGWVITEHEDQPLAWHNGGNAHSYGELARTTDGGAFVFWSSTQARSESGEWDFEELGPTLTEGALSRLL